MVSIAIRQVRFGGSCGQSRVRNADLIANALYGDAALELDGNRVLAAVVLGQALCLEGVYNGGCKLDHLLVLLAGSSVVGVGRFDGLMAARRKAKVTSVLVAGITELSMVIEMAVRLIGLGGPVPVVFVVAIHIVGGVLIGVERWLWKRCYLLGLRGI